MKAVGLVVEYNPFHNGHLHHVLKAKEDTQADVVVAVMSGSFLQRGEPALLSKRVRAEMALRTGVDVVVELPYGYAVQTAPYFAEGAVRILSALCCSSLHFGSEEGEIKRFTELATFIRTHKAEYDAYVRHYLKQGYSYPKASAEAFSSLAGSDQQLPLNQPNNILGFHYVQQLYAQHTSMQAFTTKRIVANYHDEDLGTHSIASATSIRHALNQNKTTDRVLPPYSRLLLDNYKEEHGQFHFWEAYFPYLNYQILIRSPEELKEIAECEEGLEYRLIETGKAATTFQDWINRLKTKRYTSTRLQRLFVHLLTGTTKNQIEAARLEADHSYIRLLGMSQQGRQYLNEHKKSFTLPIITREAELKHYGTLGALDQRATNCYWLTKPASLHANTIEREFKATPIYIKDE